MIKSSDNNGNTLLHYSVVHSDDVNKVHQIINEYSNLIERKQFIFKENDSGSSALKLAVEHNRFKVVKYLLKLFSSFSPDFERDPVILKLAEKKNFFDIVHLLLENGWVVNNPGERETLLHIAAEQNSVLMVEYFLENGANIEAKNAEGYTAILSAAAHNSLEVVEFFHKLNLLTQLSSFGETILSVALKHDSVNVIYYLIMLCSNDKKLMHQIFHRPDNVKNTPLHVAAERGNIDIFNKILNFFEDVNPFNDNNETPLHFAVKENNYKIVKRLLEISTFSINLPSASGTPIFSAVYCGNSDIVDLLIKNGADKGLNFDERKALLKTALLKNKTKIFQLLIKSLISSKENPNMKIELRQLCLKLAIKKQLIEIVEYLLDVSDWKDVIRRESPQKESTSPIQHLIKYMPEMAAKIFDRCIINDETDIYYYYEFIDDIYYIPNETSNLTSDDLCVYDDQTNKLKPNAKERKEKYYEIIDDHPITLMLKNNRYDLLSHKLIEAYIDSKWNTFIKWAYYSIGVYRLAFVLFLTRTILNTSPPKNEDFQHADPDKCSLPTDEKIFFVLFFVTHLTQIIYKLFRYFNLLQCSIDIVIIVFTFSILYENCLSLNSFQNVLFILYMCVCLSFANMVKKLPRFGVYVLLIFHTLKSFLRFSPIFFMFLMPFVVIFFVLLNENREISSFLHILIRTIVMMVGELEYRETIASKASPITNIVFCLFLLIITIFLMNLLIGLAVSDTTAILEKASRTRVKLQIETIHRIEIDMPKFLRRYFWRGFSKEKRIIEGNDEISKHNFHFRWFGLSKEVLKKQKSFYKMIQKSNNNGNKLLHYSVVHSDDVDKVHQIINKYSNLIERKQFIFKENENGSSALKLAVEHNRFKVVKYLLKLFSSYSPDFERDPVILKLAEKKNFFDIVQFLLENGWVVNNPGERETVLHIAAEQNNVLMGKYFLENGANIEAKNAEGYTAILSAAAHNSLEVVEFFHKLNLLTQLSRFGETILSVALKHDSVNVIYYLIMLCSNDKKLMYQIFHHPDNLKNTPLHIAAERGNIDTFNKILNFFKDVNPFNDNNETPLHFAVKENNYKIVKRLLEISTFSLNLPSASGTPLFSAVYCGNSDIVDLLIKNGADKGLNFEERKALFKTALLKNKTKIFQLLIKSLISSKEDPNMKIELRQLCLKLAIKKQLFEIVEFLLDVSDWKDVIRRESPQKESTSPIQHLIKYMPEMAAKIFDRCIINDEMDIYYYFEFIDDIYYVPNETSNLTSDNLCVYDDQTNKLKPIAKERKENYYEIIDDHPLTLMLKNNRYDLLSHKLIESYIDSKWNTFIKWGYYSICLYRLAFVLFLTRTILNTPPIKTEDFKIFFANMVKKLPRFGVYVLLIFHTFKSFLRFSPIFFMFLMPFVVIFYVLLNENREISSFLHILIRTIVMMVGELEYRDTIASKASPITNIVFCLFLLIITIFLMNLLIGLAVSDTTAILEKASRTRVKLQIETIHRIEIDMPKFLRRFFWRGFSKEKRVTEGKGEISRRIFHFRWFGLSKEVLKKQKSFYEPLNQYNQLDNSNISKIHLKESSDRLTEMIKSQKQMLQKIESMQQKIDWMIQLSRNRDMSINYIDEEVSERNALKHQS